MTTVVSPAIAPFTRRDVNSQDTWGARGTLTWQATDRLSFELMHATQDVKVDSEEFTDPAVGDYGHSRGLDAFDKGGNGERLDLSTLVVNYDWDAVSLFSASSWTEMKRFSDQDIGFLAAASGLPHLTRRRRWCTCEMSPAWPGVRPASSGSRCRSSRRTACSRVATSTHSSRRTPSPPAG